MREGGGQLSEAAGINFLRELRITGDVQHAESVESRHHSSCRDRHRTYMYNTQSGGSSLLFSSGIMGNAENLIQK